jgi:hypothetical protein
MVGDEKYIKTLIRKRKTKRSVEEVSVDGRIILRCKEHGYLRHYRD